MKCRSVREEGETAFWATVGIVQTRKVPLYTGSVESSWQVRGIAPDINVCPSSARDQRAGAQRINHDDLLGFSQGSIIHRDICCIVYNTYLYYILY